MFSSFSIHAKQLGMLLNQFRNLLEGYPCLFKMRVTALLSRVEHFRRGYNSNKHAFFALGLYAQIVAEKKDDKK